MPINLFGIPLSFSETYHPKLEACRKGSSDLDGGEARWRKIICDVSLRLASALSRITSCKNEACGLLVLVWAASGCVTVGHRYEPAHNPDSSKAVVYFYRPHPKPNILLTNTYNYAHSANLFIGDKKWAALGVNAYTYVELAPGTYTFSMRDNIAGQPMATLEFEILAGQQYFCKYTFRFVPATEFSFRVMPRKLAEKEIARTRYVKGKART